MAVARVFALLQGHPRPTMRVRHLEFIKFPPPYLYQFAPLQGVVGRGVATLQWGETVGDPVARYVPQKV